MSEAEAGKRAAAEAAAREIEGGQIVGLGTGSTAALFVRALAERIRAEGLKVTGVPTSRQTKALAEELGIPLLAIEEATEVDVLVDGADRVDPRLDMVKGGGGALLLEKLVASVSARRIYAVDAAKRVAELGRDFPVPIEVVPAAIGIVSHRLRGLALDPIVRVRDGMPFTTDSGNVILDAYLPPGAAIARWEQALVSMPGVVECGLFVGMVDVLLVGGTDGVERVEGPPR